MAMYTVLELITPEIAREYLKRNVKNRRLKPGRVADYASDMKNGRWQITPQGISFHENGTLGDGQHRLEAIIKSDTPVLMNVTYDVPNETTMFDRGANRSVPDILTIGGFDGNVANPIVVGAINFLFSLAKGKAPTEAVVSDFCLKNSEKLSKAASVCNAGPGDRICAKSPMVAAAFCALYCGLDEAGVREFFRVANTGFYSLKTQSSAIVIRNYLLREYGRNTWTQRKNLFTITTAAISDYAKGVSRMKKYRSDATPVFFKYVKTYLLDKYVMS